MNLKIVMSEFKASIKGFVRSKATLFFTLAFPIILILMFGAIFSGDTGGSFDLFVANYDYDNGDINSSILVSNPNFDSLIGNFSNVYDAIYAQFNYTEVVNIKTIDIDKYDTVEKLRDHIDDEKLNSTTARAGNQFIGRSAEIIRPPVDQTGVFAIIMNCFNRNRIGI